jgi:putative oxidoreductase
MSLDLIMMCLRVLLGLIVAAHGVQKLFDWFGGPGLVGTASFLASLGLRPARLLAFLLGLAETVAGLALAVGLLTPIAAGVVAGIMIAAITLVHWSHGFWAQQGGIEYPLVLLALSAAIGLGGPGAYAADVRYPLDLPYLALSYPESFVYTVVAAIVVVLAITLVGRIGAPARPARAH